MDHAARLHRDALVWDNHACMPLRADDRFLPELERMRQAGIDVVSLNLVFDGLPWTMGIQVLATIREWVTTRPDAYVLVSSVESVLAAKRTGRMAVTFDIEGMTALDGRVEMVGLWRDLGVRWMLVAYNDANAAGGGCMDGDDAGLTAFGRSVLEAMRRHGIVACCSHTGERTAMEVFEHAGAPVILSHSNPRALCDHPRNVSDTVIDACAATGGVVGIVGFGLFLAGGDVSAESLARHIDYVVQRVGPRNVGYSSDFVFDPAELEDFLLTFRARHPDAFPESGTIPMAPPETMPRLTEQLLALGYGDDDVRGILGGNWLRVAMEVWT